MKAILLLIFLLLIFHTSNLNFSQELLVTMSNNCISQIAKNNKLNRFCLSHTSHEINMREKDYYFYTVPFEHNTERISNNSINASVQMSIYTDFEMRYIWIYNELGTDIFSEVLADSYNVELPEGIYHIMTGYAPSLHQNTMVFKDSIELTSPVKLHLFKNEANYSTGYKFYREDYSPLRINSLFLTFLNSLIPTGLNISFTTLDSTAFIFHYNKLPDYFEVEWAIKGKQIANNGNLYLLNEQFKTFKTDTVISNNLDNLVYADFYYHLPDSIKNEIQIHTYLPESHADSRWDPYYGAPVHMRVYQDTSAHLSEKSSVFSQGVFGNSIPHGFLYSPEMRIGENTVNGYYHQDRESPSFVISDNKTVNLGLTPTYWFGKFDNGSDTIKIRSSYGRYQYLFLSQSNDVLRHYPIEYHILKEEEKFQTGYFDLWFGPAALRIGFNVDDLTITVPESGTKYEMIITDNYSEVASCSGVSNVIACFDLSLTDKNPPNIVLFQILTNNVLSNVLRANNENKVRFVAEDNEQINTVQLYFTILGDTIWSELDVKFEYPYWISTVPILPNGYYSLKLYIDDFSGNYIECVMEPAFHFGEIASIVKSRKSIKPERLTLHRIYPNPFNNTTIISFSIPSHYFEKIELSIYNILGQLVKSFTNLPRLEGLNKIHWNGKDNYNQQLSSGVYFLTLKGSDVLLNQKILIMK